MRRPRTLASRMLALAIAQMVILVIAAIVIWYFTAPPRRPPGPGPSGMPLGPLLTLVMAFVVPAIGAILTARWLVRPIETLSKTAGAIGDGDFSAKSGLVRDDELGSLARRVDEMGDKIAGQRQQERELLANVAHELRTPLSRIGVALDLAGEGDAQRARSSLAEIAVDVAELETIVDDILTVLRYDITRGAAMPVHRAATAPSAIANAAIDRMRARHPDRPLEVAIVDGLPDIEVDAMLFRRVIDNLLDNAHKYTPERTSPIRLVVERDPTHVTFDVIDRGIGIATADLPNIYNAFYRAERSRSRETGGVGLGLTLAKRIVEGHDGSIVVESGTERGTRMRVRVPIA